MSLVTPKSENIEFPLEIFGEEIAGSFLQIAEQYSVPANFTGVTALFTISGMAGNMYRTELKSSIKTILYCMMIGPSSLGKTVVYDKLCGDVISLQDEQLRKDYVAKLKAWTEDKEKAKRNSNEFTTPMPVRTIRNATSGTTEAFMKYAENNPAGFGVYFDEGRQLYAGGAYKKENTSVDFWNKAWNGKTFNDLRVDSERERYVKDPAISVLCGMQTDRISEMFNKEAIDTGLINRFLFTSSSYVKLNEDVDHFSPKKEVCEDWQMIVRRLFKDGCDYVDFNDQKFVPFSNSAKALYNSICKRLVIQSNEMISNVKEGDESKMLLSYIGKLYAYLGRFILVCAIIKNAKEPKIDDECILNAEKIYKYFRAEAKKLIITISDEQITNLNEKESRLLMMLPAKFTTREAKEICRELKLSDNYFGVTFLRKYKFGYIKQLPDKTYEKME